MHFHTILAFALLFWMADQRDRGAGIVESSMTWTLIAVFGQWVLLVAAGMHSTWRAMRLLRKNDDAGLAAQRLHHRATAVLRLAALAGFAATLRYTQWPRWFVFENVSPALQIFGDLITVAPFFVNILILWLTAYPIDREMRDQSLRLANGVDPPDQRWGLWSYLDFNLRHQMLVVAVPMTLILFAADLTRGYEQRLRSVSGWFWAPDVLLGLVALVVFVISPALLSRIWHTSPIPAGEVRDRLEALCKGVGLRCRDILVWHSDGMMINAAVMGLWGPVRYVMLSDALLDTMSTRQIESVFGHEAGHIRHRHIQLFLVFAFVGWLVVAGLMEGLARVAGGAGGLSPIALQGAGVVATALFWWLGFGWVSRRFERQADLFGARCVTPGPSECNLPCAVHPDRATTRESAGRVCATGAEVFASALDRVAILNGIPHEERSWRHSSIGSRIRFLHSMAGDPNRTARFERLLWRIKLVLVGLAVSGSVITVYYWASVPQPPLVRTQVRAMGR